MFEVLNSPPLAGALRGRPAGGAVFLLDKRRFPYYIIDIVVRLYWAERYVPGPSTGEEVPRLFLWRIALRELSIFIDESGDFGDYCFHSPYYIIAMIFHKQSTDIQRQINHLDNELSYLGLNNLCIHTGPIIRKEEIYKNMDLIERRRIFNKMMAFITMQLVKLKIGSSLFSKSEINFFGSPRDLKQNYLKPLKKKEWV